MAFRSGIGERGRMTGGLQAMQKKDHESNAWLRFCSMLWPVAMQQRYLKMFESLFRMLNCKMCSAKIRIRCIYRIIACFRLWFVVLFFESLSVTLGMLTVRLPTTRPYNYTHI